MMKNISHRLPSSTDINPPYFEGLAINQRLHVVHEQLMLLKEWQHFLCNDQIVASVNIDGPTLMVIQRDAPIRRLITELP